MKNLIKYIQENQEMINIFNETMDEINFEIICESFKCSLLAELIEQVKTTMEEYRDNTAANKYSTYFKPTNLKSIFSSSGYNWGAITDDRVKTFKSTDPEGVKMFKRMCSNRSNSINGIIAIEASNVVDKNHKYAGIIFKNPWGQISYYSLCSRSSDNTNIKPTEALQYISGEVTFYMIELNEADSTSKLRSERYKAQSGVEKLPGKDYKEMYKEMARQNMERYKKLAAKLKVEREAANDKLPEKVISTVNSVMSLVAEYGKNPTKYAKYEYDIHKLLDLIGDKSYSTMGYNKKWSTYGINGLMYLFTTYITSKLSVSTGNSYESERKTLIASRQNIEKMLEKINNSYLELKKKISEDEAKEAK